MWKIFFTYSDNSKLTLTGKSKKISEEQVNRYYNEYGRHVKQAIYQQYPKKDHEPVNFIEMAGGIK